ncbi:hypothetical protein AAKU55_005286 [Oxalobacteraceae bacterium GrIS 1.11]
MSKEPKQIEQWQADDAERLRQLFDNRMPKVSQAEFGDLHGIGTQGMVWQYLAGRRPLNIEAAVAFARGLGVGIIAFSPTIAAQIRSAALVVDSCGQAGETLPSDSQGPGWISSEAYKLLGLYYAADDDTRTEIMATATEGRKRELTRVASNEA